MTVTKERGYGYLLILVGSVVSAVITDYAPYENFIVEKEKESC